MTAVITKEATVQMAEYRQADLQYTFPDLKCEDFADDLAYRQALVEQYRAMRQQEFSYVVQNEAMKAYNVASEANAAKGKKTENLSTGAWNGYKQRPEAQDSSFVNVPSMVAIGKTPTSGESCAISANALTLQISNEMGYTGKNNLIVPKSRVVVQNGKMCVTSNNNLSAASCIHLQDSIPQAYRLSFEKKKKPTLNEAIKQGLVNAGDEISIVTGTVQGTTTSGCHAMVIVDVQKDEQGTVTNYTLQCNNPPCLKVVDANKPDYYGKRPLNCAIRTSQWITDKINSEIPSEMTVEDVLAKTQDTKSRLSDVVDDLHGTEHHYAEKKHYNDRKPVGVSEGFGEHYNNEVSKAQNVAQARAEAQPTVTPENETPTQEEGTAPQYVPVEEGIETIATSNIPTVTAEELSRQTGELAEDKAGREGAMVALKSGPVEKGVAYRKAVQELSQTDGRTAEQALKESNGGQTADKPVAVAQPQQTKTSPGYRIVLGDNNQATGQSKQPQQIQSAKREMTPEQIQAILSSRRTK